MKDRRESEGELQGDEVARLKQRVAELETRLADVSRSESSTRPGGHLLDRFADIIPTGLYVYQDGGLVYANRAGFEMAGLDPGTSKPGQISQCLDEQSLALVRRRAEARVRGEEVPDLYELCFTRASGETVWVLMRVQLIEYRGRPASLAATIGITDRKRMEDDLRASQANLNAIFESTGDYVLLSDHTGSPVYFNSAYQKIMTEFLGFEMRPGIKPHTYLPDPSARAAWEEYHRRVLGGERFSVEYCLDLLPGDPMHLEISYYPVRRGDEVVGFCEFTHDVTDRKRNEERLARIRSEQAAQLRQIAGGLSHEIHNALFPANSTLHKLRDRLVGGDSEASQRSLRLLDLGLKSLRRALDLTESVRLFSRLDNIVSPQSTDLPATVSDVLQQRYPRLKEHGVTVRVDLPGDLRVMCPESHLHSVFDNLMGNALDAIKDQEGGVLTIVGRMEVDTAVITVSDTGSGIAADDLAHVFEPFFTTKHTEGTGLGLAIVKRIVDLCDGQLTVDSKPGEGTTFAIRLPGPKSQS